MAAAARRLWSRYEARLAARPLPTKMATSFSLMIAGDVIAQSLDPSGPEKWDVKRTAAMGVCGLCMHAPWFHYWCAALPRLAYRPREHSASTARSPAGRLLPTLPAAVASDPPPPTFERYA